MMIAKLGLTETELVSKGLSRLVGRMVLKAGPRLLSLYEVQLSYLSLLEAVAARRILFVPC